MTTTERRRPGERIKQLFQLRPIGKSLGNKTLLLGKKRMLVGRSEACDVVLPFPDITAIHAVIEILDGKMRLFDMNSRNGSYINEKKVTVEEFKVGDVLRFSTHEFHIRPYERNVAPPVLDMLDPELPPMIELPPEIEKPKLPSAPPSNVKTVSPSKAEEKRPVAKKADLKEEVPYVQYPLAKDPKADFSEYIFEDADTLFPIFKYEFNQAAIEVIILFQDRIFSVDYLPMKNGKYRLVGHNPATRDVEYPYLRKKERVQFIEVKNGTVSVNPILGYDVLILEDSGAGNKPKVSAEIILKEGTILRLSQNDLQIFVRLTEAPPKVAPAHIISKDAELKKYLLLMFLLVSCFTVALNVFTPDKELIEEKAPERIATILHKPKPTPVPTPPPHKVEMKPDVQQVQQAPEVPKEEIKKTEKLEVAKTTVSTKKQALPKKGEPMPDKKTVNKPMITGQVDKGKPKVSQPAPVNTAPSQVSKGNVDVYKSADFSSSVSTLLAKGGTSKSAKAVTTETGGWGTSGVAGSGESATLENAKVAGKVGSLTGAASGSIDSSYGVQGVVNKKGAYVVGVPSDTVIMGSMDPDLIRKILMDHLPQFRSCYQRELEKADSGFSGIVPLDFVIGASGHVARAGVAASGDDVPPKVVGCVLNVLRGIRFPAPPGGGQVEVKQPMNFRLSQ